jgi:putative nucleotidyltransferase with HDIG domain
MPAHILVVDDEPQVCGVIRDALTSEGLSCTSVSQPTTAQELVRRGGYSILITDVAMPETTGLDLLAQARRNDPHCKVIIITAFASVDSLAGALQLGAYDFLEKPFDLSRLVRSVRDALSGELSPFTARAARAMKTAAQQRQTHLESIRALAQAVEAKDPYTRRHSDQVAHYATHLAREAGMTAEAVESIRVAALLHDVGKIGIPDHILTKPGPLTAKEFAYVRRHPALGSQILENISVFSTEARLVRHHHENWDGSGYPDGLAGQAIPPEARIINLADSIDAMLMKRTYKDAYSVGKMLGELQSGAGTQFDPDMAKLAVNWCRSHVDLLILPV